MRGTDIMDQISKTYAFDHSSPTNIISDRFYDYLELSLAYAFIVQEKLASECSHGEGRPKTLIKLSRETSN
ncbi:Hypothetical protein FKW44_012183 [Caligus rogercresseyi]|uniref:Uncharacterized protein n=1 Tax=Caligus rogercresseyi TaxID=217165 RepID=A0A7T8HJE0_CALRO|nr:Hypothetical protein FKW44_012183 [Caligus rogercresseyi]